MQAGILAGILNAIVTRATIVTGDAMKTATRINAAVDVMMKTTLTTSPSSNTSLETVPSSGIAASWEQVVTRLAAGKIN